MGWLHSLFFPLKKFWGKLRTVKKTRQGIYVLYEDVQSCSCEDVHALWTLLVNSDTNYSYITEGMLRETDAERVISTSSNGSRLL